jgi:hypothetical protein
MSDPHPEPSDAPRASKTGSYAVTPAEVLTDPRLGWAAKGVFGLMGLFANRDGICWPSHNTLARLAGVTPHAIAVSIRALEDAGQIRKLAETTAGGARTRTRYRLRRHGEPGWGVGKPVTQVEGKPLIHPKGKPLIQVGTLDTQGGTPATEVGNPLTPKLGNPLTPNSTSTNNTSDKTMEQHQPAASPPSADVPPVQEQEPPDAVARVWAYYRARIQPRARECPAAQIRTRLKTYSVEELQRGMDRFAADSWYMEHCAWRGGKWYFASNDRAEQFLNMKPRTNGGNGGRDHAQPGRGAAASHGPGTDAGARPPERVSPFARYGATTLDLDEA